MTAILQCIFVKVFYWKYESAWYECAAEEWLGYRSNQFNSWAVIFLYIQWRNFFLLFYHMSFGIILKFSWIIPLVRNLILFERRVIFGSNPLRRTFRKDQYPLNFMTSSTTADSKMSYLLKSRVKMFMV